MYKYSKPLSIKANNETVDEEIVNLFNFTLRNNTYKLS
jgi:hypothetical protein